MPRDTYTKEQRDALEGMKEEGLELGAARKEFVNRILLPNGKVTKDLDAMRNAIQKPLQEAAKAEDYKKAAILRDKLAEFDEHIAQKRFLFVMGDDEMPLIYFQCNVSHNEDLYPKEAEK